MKITLLGDSIRIQYQDRVRELLGDSFEVYAPESNCRFAKYTLRGLFDWRADMRDSRIVHWNNGLWDVCNLFGDGLFTSEEEFVGNMLRIADLLIERYETVIFATITPVSEKNLYNKNEDIRRYNELLVPELRKRGIVINDLHALLASDLDRYISDDHIHLTPEGIALCAHQVAEVIRREAQKLPPEPQRFERPTDLAEQGAPIIFG